MNFVSTTKRPFYQRPSCTTNLALTRSTQTNSPCLTKKSSRSIFATRISRSSSPCRISTITWSAIMPSNETLQIVPGPHQVIRILIDPEAHDVIPEQDGVVIAPHMIRDDNYYPEVVTV